MLSLAQISKLPWSADIWLAETMQEAAPSLYTVLAAGPSLLGVSLRPKWMIKTFLAGFCPVARSEAILAASPNALHACKDNPINRVRINPLLRNTENKWVSASS